MNKRERAKFEKLLANIAKVTNTDLDDLKEKANVSKLYSVEDSHYELQSVLNFYKARIEPRIGKIRDENNKLRDETNEEFDARYREWRFKICTNCNEQFAYAYQYEGVGTCSLDCAEAELLKIGIVFSRHRDLKRRWGHRAHPAIVSAPALESLRNLYGDDVVLGSENSLTNPSNLERHSA